MKVQFIRNNKPLSITGTLLIVLFFAACNKPETGIEILKKAINSIDTITTVSYKQNMARTNPRDINDTIYRHRKMIFERLKTDSIVGVKGHWYMYNKGETRAIYEDIYDGERLIRKNNDDFVARLYDLKKHPSFKNYHFWSHNTPFAMRFEFQYMLNKPDIYTIERLADSTINNNDCYQISIRMENYSSMPGFNINPLPNDGIISTTRYFFNKKNYYPIKLKSDIYHKDNPDETFFLEQYYYDLIFNQAIKDTNVFNTTEEWLTGYEITDILPKQ